MDRPIGYGIPRFRFSYFYFHLDFLKKVQSFEALTAKIFLMNNSVGGRQVWWNPFFLLSGENKCKKEIRQNDVMFALPIFKRVSR
jgi:hypothetical protein